MKREEVVKWLESKGKIEVVRDNDDEWCTLTFNATVAITGEFMMQAEIRVSVFQELVLVTVKNGGGEEKVFTFRFDGCHKDRFENETVTLEFL